MARTFSGRRLRELRLAAGLSSERLAITVDRSAFSIQGYELGRVRPPADVLGALADALGTPIDRFFTEEAVHADAA